MSHWGPSYGEIQIAEAKRKAQNTDASTLLDAIIQALREANQPEYSTHELQRVSLHSHGEAVRERLEEVTRNVAYRLNVATAVPRKDEK